MAHHNEPESADLSQQSDAELEEMIYHALIGVNNGLLAEQLIFTSTSTCDLDSNWHRAEKALAKFLLSRYHWSVRCFWIRDVGQLKLILLSSRRYNSFESSHDGLLKSLVRLESTATDLPDSLCRLAYELDNRSLSQVVPEQAGAITKRLLSIARSDGLLVAALAAEILTQQGMPTLPTEAIAKSQRIAGSTIQTNGEAKHAAATFETRISVDNYNFFELVHPAYFRQTVALTKLITKFVHDPSVFAVDVGPGPGTNLLAFHELMPQTTILAIEPSDVAFHYLRANFSGNTKITCLQEDFLSVPVDSRKVDYIMSTGTSHHFNTGAFLQRSTEWLRPGGYWFIADEMISAFETRAERSLNLLRHHLAYMAPLCFPWPNTEGDIRTTAEKKFVEDFNDTVPQAKFCADNRDLSTAETLCRALLARTEKHGFTTKVSDPLLAFWRLQWLELEALVAGLDYKVEQKTFPRHFINMAEDAGLKCIAHERVYGTVGNSDEGGGTHVLAFQKR